MKLENLQEQVVACRFKGHNPPFRRPSLSLASPVMAIQQQLIDQIFTSYTCRLSSLEQLITARYCLKHTQNFEFTSMNSKSSSRNKTQDYLQLVSESSKKANDCVKKEKEIVKLFCSVQADHLIMRQIAVNLCNKVVEINSKLYQVMLSLGAKMEAANFLEKQQSLKIQLSGTLQMNGEQSFSAIMSLIIFSREVLHQEIILCNQQYFAEGKNVKNNNPFSTQSLHQVSQQSPQSLVLSSAMGSFEFPFQLFDDYLQPLNNNNNNNFKNEQQSSQQLSKYNNKCIVGAMTQILPQKTRKNSKNSELSSYAQQQIHYKCIEIAHRSIFTPTKKHKTSLETASSIITSNITKEGIKLTENIPQQQKQKEDLILKPTRKEKTDDISNRDKRAITIGQGSIPSVQSASSQHNRSSDFQKYYQSNQQNSQVKSISDKEKDKKNGFLREQSYLQYQQYFNQQYSSILDEHASIVLALTTFKSLETINEKKIYLEKMYSSMLKANSRCSTTIKAYLEGAMLSGKVEGNKREKNSNEQLEQTPSNIAIFLLQKLKSKIEIQNKVNLQKDLFQLQVQAKGLKKSRTVRTFKLPKEICVSKQSTQQAENLPTEITETLQAVKVPGEPFSKQSGETTLFSSPKRAILSSSSADKREIQLKIDEKTPQFRIIKPNSLTFKILTPSSPQGSKINSRQRFSSPTSEKQQPQQQQQHPQPKQFHTKKILKDDRFGKMLFLDEQMNYESDKSNPQSGSSNTEKNSTKKQYQQQYQSTTPKTLASPNMISIIDRKEPFTRPSSNVTSLLARCSSDQNYQFNTKNNYYALNQAKIYFPLISQMRTDSNKNDNPFQDTTLLKCQPSSCKSPLIFPK